MTNIHSVNSAGEVPLLHSLKPNHRDSRSPLAHVLEQNCNNAVKTKDQQENEQTLYQGFEVAVDDASHLKR